MLRACFRLVICFLLFLWGIPVNAEEIQEDGKLADQRGMLLTEVGLLRQVVFESLLSSDLERQSGLRRSVLEDVADGNTWSAIFQLGRELNVQLFQFAKSVAVRDLGILRALGDIGTFELVAALEAAGIHTENRSTPQQSRAKWLASAAKDVRWLKHLLPRGDRSLIAVAHAVLSWVMSSMTQAWWLAEQAAAATVQRVCEVGFNGGHSALAMLLSAPASAKLVSFDLMSKSYTPACHRLVRTIFPRQHILIEGPSNVTIPQFVFANLDSKCDLIFVDGGHAETEALADLLYMSMLVTQRTLIVMDDVGCKSQFCAGPTKAWNSFIMSGRISEHACQAEAERRWCWGTYQL